MLASHRTFILSALIGLFVLVLDQASKVYLLFVVDLPLSQPIVLNSFIEFIVVWNRGISYGLFQQHSDVGRWFLIIFSGVAAIGLMIWLWRVHTTVLALSLAMIIGGAIGNMIDRIAYGAVFDFIHVHVGTFSWYVFNVADAAIVAGVIGLVYDSLILERLRDKKAAN